MSIGRVPVPYDENSSYDIKCTIDGTDYIQHIANVDANMNLINPAEDHRTDFNNASVSVTDTETVLTTGMVGTKTIVLFNTDTSNTVYIGKTGVSVANGYPILPETEKAFDCSATVYGICDTGLTADVRVLELK